MDLIKQINKEDIDKVITYSQNIPNPKTDELIKTWARNKQALSENFLQGKVIVSSSNTVTFEMGDEDQKNKFCDFLNYIENLMILNSGLYSFLGYIGYKDFYNNKLSEDYLISAKDNKKILKGSKVVKAFKYFIDNESLLADLQSKASELIQSNKVEGYLHLSVHPLDFLSSSENNYNWRSCHSLDGEYRAGNLSYMDDASTIIAYLSSNRQEKLPRFPQDVPWNSKKWRMLIHFNNTLDTCFAGRQYPFFSRAALDLVKELFDSSRKAEMNYWTFDSEPLVWDGWYNTYIDSIPRENGENEMLDSGRYYIINQGIHDLYETVQDAEDSRHFNDVRKSSVYTRPYYMFKRRFGVNIDMNFLVGSAVHCLWCGQNIIDGRDSMMCHKCECDHGDSESDDYITCDCCGSRVYGSEAFYMSSSDEWVCPHCAETETFICESCGRRTYNDEKHWQEDKGYVCDECFHQEEIFENITDVSDLIETEGGI